jgi:hypothetical protein
MKIVSIILLSLVIASCSTMNIVSTSSSHLVSRYCKVPSKFRLKLRAVIAKEIAPNKIIIECHE